MAGLGWGGVGYTARREQSVSQTVSQLSRILSFPWMDAAGGFDIETGEMRAQEKRVQTMYVHFFWVGWSLLPPSLSD